MSATLETESPTRSDIRIEDVEYQRQHGRALLARLYRPAGPRNATAPFPAVLQVHGGAWTSKDRTDNGFIAKALAESGILVASIDFRMPPEAPYPASLADINLGIRWLKARARTYGSRPGWVGLFGTSSGGHQALLAAMRPDDPRHRALPLVEAPETDARVAFVVSGWGVLDPLLRYHLAKKAGSAELVKSHDDFWGNEPAMSEGSPPAILDRGEKVHLPPALLFGGDADEWVPVDVTKRLAAGWRRSGGEVEAVLYPGANHGFMTGKPDAPYAARAIELIKGFVRKHAA